MVSKNGTIKIEAVIKDQKYRVIETKFGNSDSVWSSLDTIKNETNGNIKQMKRVEWKKLFDKFK